MSLTTRHCRQCQMKNLNYLVSDRISCPLKWSGKKNPMLSVGNSFPSALKTGNPIGIRFRDENARAHYGKSCLHCGRNCCCLSRQDDVNSSDCLISCGQTCCVQAMNFDWTYHVLKTSKDLLKAISFSMILAEIDHQLEEILLGCVLENDQSEEGKKLCREIVMEI
uniref:Uncharacterized protein n=1 Tax=Cacopsylla melanoneura TaxID=428564 RepID=A0A8D8WFU3_9HEMI